MPEPGEGQARAQFENMSEPSHEPTHEGDPSQPGRPFLLPEASAHWSKRQIEAFLTNVCAEVYRLEAERRRTKRMISGASELGTGGTGAEALWRRHCALESRLQSLASASAGLRARLELRAPTGSSE